MDSTLHEALETLRRAGYAVTPALNSNKWHLIYPPASEGAARMQELVGRDRLLDIAYQVEQEGDSEDERKFSEAPEVEDVARRLIPQFHSHLVEAKIRYLFRYGTWSSRGQTTLGKCQKCSARDKYLTGADFLILINGDEWETMDSETRTALVDHELCHAGKDEDSEGNPKWVMWNHDVEEFSAIIERHGLWRPAVERFGRAAALKYRQLELPIGRIAEDAQAVIDDIVGGVDLAAKEDTTAAEVAAAGDAPDWENAKVELCDGEGNTLVETTVGGLKRTADELAVRRGATAGPGY